MTTASKSFTPLTVELISEGRFLDQANADLAELQEQLMAFRDEHQDRAKGAKATLTITVTLACEKPDDELFSVKAQTKRTLPARPADVTAAMGAANDDGQPRLFVRRSGSTRETPRQTRLATDDGRTVDTETGAVAGE